jgi:hypothetical protein
MREGVAGIPEEVPGESGTKVRGEIGAGSTDRGGW